MEKLFDFAETMAAYNAIDVAWVRAQFENMYNQEKEYNMSGFYNDAPTVVVSGRRTPPRDMNEVHASNEKAMEEAMADFVPVTIYVPRKLWDSASSRNSRTFTAGEQYEIIALVEAEIPEFIDVKVGLTYEYPSTDGGRVNRYQVAQVGDGHVIIRRMNKNNAGAKGSRLATTKEKIANDIRSGTAVIVPEEAPTLSL